jgi:membrane protein YdbS with pleckstrin-like domain
MDKKSLREPIFITRTSRKLYFPVYLMIFILITVLTFIKIQGLQISILAIASVLVFTILGIKVTELHRLGSKYEVNPLSLIHTRGYFGTNSKRIDLDAISHMDVMQTPWQRLLNFGDIEVMMFGERAVTIKNINHPHRLASLFEEKMKELKQQNV